MTESEEKEYKRPEGDRSKISKELIDQIHTELSRGVPVEYACMIEEFQEKHIIDGEGLVGKKMRIQIHYISIFKNIMMKQRH